VAHSPGAPQREISPEFAEAARLSAATILHQQAEFIYNTVRRTGGAETSGLDMSLILARNATAAVAQPVEYIGTCWRDGTTVDFDYVKKTYCCKKGHCPPDAPS